MRLSTLLAALASLTPIHAKYIDWRTFKGHGVNLGGWLVQETSIDQAFWNKYANANVSDEWTLCQNLGARCGPVLEHRYSTFITPADIDHLARAGVTILRIPTTYAAWIDLPGSALYSGHQVKHLERIANYAITHYNMHIIIDVHSLPGGINGLTIGEATGHWDWFHNNTALDQSLRVVDSIIGFVQNSSSPQSYTIAPINEPTDNNKESMENFGTPVVLTDKGAQWVAKYINAVLKHVAAVNPKIPVMFQGSFKNPEYWYEKVPADANLVFDVHVYHYEHPPNVTSATLPAQLCADAKEKASTAKFPSFMGEWAIQAAKGNELALRERNINAGMAAFAHYAQGSCYWTAKFTGNDSVVGQGVQADYWDFRTFAEHGWVHPDNAFAC